MEEEDQEEIDFYLSTKPSNRWVSAFGKKKIPREKLIPSGVFSYFSIISDLNSDPVLFDPLEFV